MLEGLEASELQLSDVWQNNEVFRFDSEYFAKDALNVVCKLKELGAPRLAEMAFITDGIHTSLPFVDDGEVKVLSAKHPKENYIDRANFETVSAAYHALNPRTALRTNDVLISTVGTIGNSAVVTPDLLPANSDRHIGIVRLHDTAASPYYLSTFMLGRYGRTQSVRETTGNVQPNLFISKIGQLLVPRFGRVFETTIASTVEAAYRLREFASKHLVTAEKSLLHALGLNNWQAAEPLAYTRSSRDAFAAGRLDAEYFTPRISALRTLLGRDGLCLADVASVRHERFKAEGASSFEYIEIGGVQADGTVIAETTPLHEAPSRATQHVRNGDVVTSTVRPIRRLSALISKEQNGAVCSSGFVVLEPDAIAPETLLTYLRLSPICELMDLHTSASLYPAISEKDLMALPVPSIDANTQASVKSYVQSAQQTRHRAAQFIEAAKRAVEIAIEQDEAAGLAYLAAANALNPE